MKKWSVEVTGAGLSELKEDFLLGPITDDSGRRWLNEDLVDQIGALKIHVYADEHPPPHFAVSFQNQSANFRISDCGRLTTGLERFDRNIRKWHSKNKALLIKTWDETRPTDCPVGRYQGG
jgi:hypothetical protein